MHQLDLIKHVGSSVAQFDDGTWTIVCNRLCKANKSTSHIVVPLSAALTISQGI